MSWFGSDSESSSFEETSPSGGLDGVSSGGANQDLQEFIMAEKQKQQITATMFEFNDICWEKCQSDKVDSKTETCLTNCVNRFIDVSLFITNRYGQLLSKSMEGL
uniref:Mitochondrial import inner membrane translocase subunit n=1 Tax=Cacopsylla melanoneura TaxID=428564 RepID=A0A8D8QEV4_9HEMI